MIISEIIVISVDRTENTWPIEGEAVFEGDFSTAFAAVFYPDENEVEGLEFDVTPQGYDTEQFSEMLVAAVLDFDESGM